MGMTAGNIRREMLRFRPHLMCLTSSFADWNQLAGGHEIVKMSSDRQENHYSVRLWSKHPWKAITLPGDLKYVTGGMTQFAGKSVMCIGVNALRTRDRGLWVHKITFLERIKRWLSAFSYKGPTIVLGDFHQRITRQKSMQHRIREMFDAYDGFEFVTAGEVPPLKKPVRDHVCVRGDFGAYTVETRLDPVRKIRARGRLRSTRKRHRGGVFVTFDKPD